MNDRELVCPRCGGPMTTYSRANVQIDQCENCRGIFLDRGELEQLVNAESSYYEQPAASAPPGYPPPGYPPPGYDDSDHHGGHHDNRYSGRRRSFLHELFD